MAVAQAHTESERVQLDMATPTSSTQAVLAAQNSEGQAYSHWMAYPGPFTSHIGFSHSQAPHPLEVVPLILQTATVLLEELPLLPQTAVWGIARRVRTYTRTYHR